MSVEDEKKPRKAPAKKAVAPKKTVAPKAAKAVAPKAPKKATAKSANGSNEIAAATLDSKVSPTHAQIAERAYRYFLERGREHGFHEDDWFRAEQELQSKHT